MSVDLIVRILRRVPSIACVKEEAIPTAAKIRQLRDGFTERPFAVLTGLGALYGPFELAAGSDGFNTGFALPEVLQAMMRAVRDGDWQRVHDIYSRFAALIVCEQQPGLAIRKELFRRRGLITSPRVRHPGATISPMQSKQLDEVLAHTLAGTDITRPITAEGLVSAS
jgi:4-hydroxy-tetrahydrodipicolinate synthase